MSDKGKPYYDWYIPECVDCLTQTVDMVWVTVSNYGDAVSEHFCFRCAMERLELTEKDIDTLRQG